MILSALFAMAAPPRPPVTEAEWLAAEAELVRHYAARGQEAEVAQRFSAWPFMFRLFVDREYRAYEIVQAGRVVTEHGLVPLQRYLEAQGAWERPQLTVADLLDVIHVFDAWPPLDPARGYGERSGYASEYDLDELLPSPSFERHPGELRLRLFYPLREGSARVGPDAGSLPGPALVRAGRWDIAFRRGKAAAWQGTVVEYPRP